MCSRLLLCVSFLCAALLPQAVRAGENVAVITKDNFSDILKGEWMVEFFAPWCPACKQFTHIWEQFGDWATENSENEGVRVGKVDVTTDSMLSGQFMVTHLPTIFHISDGEVRAYSKARELSALISFIEDDEWKELEAIPWWRSPTALHMRAIGTAFWLAEKVKEIQVYLEQEYDMPTYGVFIVIAVGTIVVGLMLGVVTICCIEICMRSFYSGGQPQPTRKQLKAKLDERKADQVRKKPKEDKGLEVEMMEGEHSQAEETEEEEEEEEDREEEGGEGEGRNGDKKVEAAAEKAARLGGEATVVDSGEATAVGAKKSTTRKRTAKKVASGDN